MRKEIKHMSKICIYAICKNELKFVEQWLENMSEADYIVVLDTGSTDGTYEKLQQDPRVTRVEQEVITPWRFDVARNRSMDLIPDDADILVCTDFDELFEPGWAQFLRDNWVPGYHTRCHYKYAWKHDSLGNNQFVFTYDKIHTKDYHWIFPVHEVLWQKEPDFIEMVLDADSNIFLHHWQDESKSRGNYLDLLHLSCEENPNCSHVWSLLTREYVTNEDYKTAIQYGLETLRKPDIDECSDGWVLLQTLYLVAFSYLKIKNYDEALWYCQEFIRVNSTYREPYFIMAQVFNECGVFTMAEAAALAGFKHTTQKFNWVETSHSWTSEGHAILGAVYLNLKNYTESAKHLKQALEWEPDNIALIKQYVTVLEELIDKIE